MGVTNMIIRAKCLQKGMVIYNTWSDYVCTVEHVFHDRRMTVITHDNPSGMVMYRKPDRPINLLGYSTKGGTQNEQRT